jgi:shikimate dehydrogenase|tara:strand:+ start:4 stop:798 length:795 start_codon:yes stop_codon:yes gene_type:complete
MKKYLVIGNPIEHSLSPKIHNFWMKKHNINALYEKKFLKEVDLKSLILEVRNGTIDGINVTVPFKKLVIPFVDRLTSVANESRSVNTIYKSRGSIIGDNTDIIGFARSIEESKYIIESKKVFILGAGGVVPSIIIALKNMRVSKIIVSNRTKKNSEDIKKMFSNVEVLDWGKITDFDIIINATSLGLKKDDEIKLNFQKILPNKFFYDIIYNPAQTNFLKEAKKLGHKIENGKMMFLHQAAEAFNIWHGVKPEINDETKNILND